MIYGITGKKFAGKDTLANALKKADPKFTILHFADQLKYLCTQIFPVTAVQLTDPLEKEKPFDMPINMDLYTIDMGDFTGLKIQGAAHLAYNPRELMQYFGAEYVREADPNYWVDHTMALARRLIHKGKKIIITDTRFPNEFEAIRKEGGKIIKIIRNNPPKSSIGTLHRSETEMDKIRPDYAFSLDSFDLMGFNRVAGEILNGR